LKHKNHQIVFLREQDYTLVTLKMSPDRKLINNM